MWSSAFLSSSESHPARALTAARGATGTLAGGSRASGDISCFLHSAFASTLCKWAQSSGKQLPAPCLPLQSWAFQCLPAQLGGQEHGEERPAPMYLHACLCVPKMRLPYDSTFPGVLATIRTAWKVGGSCTAAGHKGSAAFCSKTAVASH